MSEKSIKEVLVGAVKILSSPDKWTKGVMARDAEGNPAACLFDYASCFCMIGAIKKSSGNHSFISANGDELLRLFYKANDRPYEADSYVRVMEDHFNDKPETTYEQMYAVLNKMAELAE